MWSLTRPAERTLERFRAEQGRREHSYREVGASCDGSPAGYVVDHNRVRLGEGGPVFEAAAAALRAWRHFPRPWVEIYPADAPVEVGTVVVILFRLLGLWGLSAARIVYVVDEAGPPRRFGFAYGTLPGHVEQGEELFTIVQEADGAVFYELRAFSRPRYWAARLAYPVTRRLQRRFVRDSQAAMRQAVAGAREG